LKRLVLILKIWLQHKRLDVVYDGGLGGYALINMLVVVSKTDSHPNHEFSLARQFVRFFEIFGEKFNCYEHAISLAVGTVIKKEEQVADPKWDVLKIGNGGIHIIDPINPYNNITKGLFRYPFLVQEFKTQLELFKEARKTFKFSRTLVFSDLFSVNIDSVLDAQEYCTRTMFTIDRVSKGFNLSIENDENFEDILKFLRPSKKYDYYDYTVKPIPDSSDGSSVSRISGESLCDLPN
jgi:DNA polymerase sigma